ncbi:Membrane protein involved in the export of O-antigen and teichoic acid [Kaistia soli DSM 19436]|uniref:Membrane protein involved in the export of O-antigen and teichoic acid n=1 Tax=Kaistia soli DSM 19436 TaxID=1122133 RepID=A0A1M4Y1S8_9HYPH|nr:lipopolysaccharide biosynthesis protein [Kaistia soli]SHE99711.1 Membrane protein involved in the export of O-antigen and teichoic acid [Kaistia soli DSM 19436]
MSVRRSIAFSALDRYLTQVLTIGTTMVMARILTPAETGLFFVANAVIVLADNFREFGVSNYIVQERTISRAMVQCAFTVTCGLSLVIGAGFFLGADALSAFYGEPHLKPLIEAATLSFLVIPFATPVLSLLRRDLAFRALAIINVLAAVGNTIVTIVLGLGGYGAISYMWGYVAANAIMAFAAYSFRPELWMYRPSLSGIRRLLSFGVASSSVTLITMAYEMLPRLAFGKLLGFDAVGLYSRAIAVCQLPDRAIVAALQPVVLPAMAGQAREGRQLKPAYLHGFELMSAVQWPMLLMLAILADPAVKVLLGSQWGAVPPLVRLVAIGTMALAPAFLTYPVLVASGRIRDTVYISVISVPPSILLVIYAAKVYGLLGVAASLLVIAPLQMLISLLFIRRAIGLTFRELASAACSSGFLTLGTALVPCLILVWSPRGFDLDWLQTCGALLGAAVGWGAALLVGNHPLGQEIAVVVRHVFGALRLQRPAMNVASPE